MIRFKIKELMAKQEYDLGRRLTIGEVSKATAIHRMTLSKMINQRGYSTTTDHLDRLCAYFGCTLEDVAEFVPETHRG
ncbi:helix-turn-helix domain-containing protein [Vreelandella jeotgali]|uniref:helix-turn-helix domain-containing protein n=1 Tax=Vreelandella jeotgali TaxID=553386 RepID=UPI000A03E255|nr:helix-turn-helix transcriptional regulator [Halomonas jeotgali]